MSRGKTTEHSVLSVSLSLEHQYQTWLYSCLYVMETNYFVMSNKSSWVTALYHFETLLFLNTPADCSIRVFCVQNMCSIKIFL